MTNGIGMPPGEDTSPFAGMPLQAAPVDAIATKACRASGWIPDDSWWSISTDMMFVTAPDGRLLRANPAWHDTLGWSSQQLSGDVLSWLEHPADRSARRKLLEAVPADPATPIRFETRFGTADGRWLHCLCRVRRNSEGNTDWAAQDITAEHKREEALSEMQNLLRQERMITELGRMTAGVLHDVNNLLQVIGGSAERLRKERSDSARGLRYLDAILHATGRARMLTARLSHLSRRERSTTALFDVAETILGLREILTAILGERVELVLDLCPGRCLLHADPVELEAAVINLAVNARDAMAYEGRLSICLCCSDPKPDTGALPTGGSMSVSVADTGPGIAPENLSRIFEPFFTTKPAGKGSGIGLAQVQDFARQCRGEVVVDSTVGQGTRITLLLPTVGCSSAADDVVVEGKS